MLAVSVRDHDHDARGALGRHHRPFKMSPSVDRTSMSLVRVWLVAIPSPGVMILCALA